MKKNYCLLAVTGMSPQVVTETLYALHKASHPMPSTIKIITTAIGKNQAWLTLGLGGRQGNGQLQQFLNDYNLPHIEFTEEDIWVVCDAEGNALDDVLTHEQHRSMADFITTRVAQLTSDKEMALHASLAGGRKTMTFFMGYAMSLFGRDFDQLSHVLVTQGFEGLPEFFYPTPKPSPISTRNNGMLDASKAQVTLADIPFVRMREDIPNNLLTAKSKYSEVIDSLNRAKLSPTLSFNASQRTINCSGCEIRLEPMVFAFYAWLARRTFYEQPGILYPTEVGELDYVEPLLYEYAMITGQFRADEKRQQVFDSGVTKLFFEQNKSKLVRKLKSALGERGADPFLVKHVSDHWRTGQRLYGINLAPSSIQMYN